MSRCLSSSSPNRIAPTITHLKTSQFTAVSKRVQPFCIDNVNTIITIIFVDKTIILQGIEFQWDAEKAETNWQKHDVQFQTACELFFDPFICPFDDEIIDGEERHTVIGMIKDWRILYVVYLWRGDVIRLISTRSATTHERKIYEDGTA